MRLTSRRCVLRPALLLLAVATAPGAFAAEPLSVMIDHAKVMHISRPAEVVIVGNPGIADATIQDQQTLIVTGRSFGSTNLIVSIRAARRLPRRHFPSCRPPIAS